MDISHLAAVITWHQHPLATFWNALLPRILFKWSVWWDFCFRYFVIPHTVNMQPIFKSQNAWNWISVLKLIYENNIFRIIYGLLMKRQIIFLSKSGPKFVVKYASKPIKHLWQKQKKKKKKKKKRQFAWARKIIQTFKLWNRANVWLNLKVFDSGKSFRTFDVDFKHFDKIFRNLEFSGQIVSSPACHVPIQNSLLKNIFGHKTFICQPIFKMFAAYFTTNLDLSIAKKIFCLQHKEKNSLRKFILRKQRIYWFKKNYLFEKMYIFNFTKMALVCISYHCGAWNAFHTIAKMVWHHTVLS